jgi:hypothetical protein
MYMSRPTYFTYKHLVKEFLIMVLIYIQCFIQDKKKFMCRICTLKVTLQIFVLEEELKFNSDLPLYLFRMKLTFKGHGLLK